MGQTATSLTIILGRIGETISSIKLVVIGPDICWNNSLSNAIKYGGEPPRVELGATSRAEGMVSYWVQDNGRGLTREEQARLFIPFTRLNQVSADGQGLGLSIVQRIVTKLGGQVGVESKGIPGHGSRFSFTLPRNGAFASR